MSFHRNLILQWTIDTGDGSVISNLGMQIKTNKVMGTIELAKISQNNINGLCDQLSFETDKRYEEETSVLFLFKIEKKL